MMRKNVPYSAMAIAILYAEEPIDLAYMDIYEMR